MGHKKKKKPPLDIADEIVSPENMYLDTVLEAVAKRFMDEKENESYKKSKKEKEKKAWAHL